MAPPAGKVTVDPQKAMELLDELWDDVTFKELRDVVMAPIEAREALRQGLRDALEGASEFFSAVPGLGFIGSAIQRDLLHPVELPPKGASEARQYEHYKQMLEARGFTLDPTNPTVVGLRGLDTKGDAHDTTSAAKYDDTIVVLTKDAKGHPHVSTFPGSTHPGQSTSATMGSDGVPDVNGDRQADVGMINAGEYKVVPTKDHAGNKAWAIQTVDGSGRLPGVRDTNHDGVYSEAERQASQSRAPAADALTGVMIHQGGPSNPWSTGCVNLSQNSNVYPAFIKAVGGSDQSMKLVILDKNAN